MIYCKKKNCYKLIALVNITINSKFCKGCMLCVEVCPQNVFEASKDKINEKGYKLAEVVNSEKCVKCRKCEMICPDFAITVEDEENNDN
ncbi:MAG: 4Fe-4S dicluster domain-containing protein [Candidatus Helarchaeota archaeon]